MNKNMSYGRNSTPVRPYRTRHYLPGHQVDCTGNVSSLGIRHEDGKYRIVRTCLCGSLRQDGEVLFNTHAEAWAMLRLLDNSNNRGNDLL